MPQLRDLQLKASYHKGKNDIAGEFYLPCVSASRQYDRAVGFFNSTIYTIAWPRLREFVEAGGRMRIICSPALQLPDVEALSKGYTERIELESSLRLRDEVEAMTRSPSLGKPTAVLASLVALGVLELRVAFVGDAKSRRLFHDKVGLFSDNAGDTVAFKGSMNETWSGLSLDGNLESVDVFLSWESPREALRVAEEVAYFNQLWNNEYDGVVVKPFPEVAKNELLSVADVNNWVKLADEVAQDISEAQALSADPETSAQRRTPRPHQAKALHDWTAKGRRGIFEHATGSGKTFTALCAVRDAFSRQEVVVILVPSELLLKQWANEVQGTLGDLSPAVLLCGGGHSRWREERLLASWSKPRDSGRPRVVITTMQTAASAQFREMLVEGDHLFLVADEVHRLGSPQNRTLFSLRSGPRLGLSATPERAGDPEGTAALLDYFEGIVPPPYTLRDAILAGVLTPYMYHVHTVTLSVQEQDDWDSLSAQIGQLYARLKGDTSTNPALASRLDNLRIKRARIIKGASGKLGVAVAIVRQNLKAHQKWLVYCEGIEQLRALQSAFASAGIPTTEYHSSMAGDGESTLAHFAQNGGVLLSIRCLDEGVDIPSVTHALVLASSQNPREFIQRRGRILRRFPGKSLAFLYDIIVVPRDTSGEAPDMAVTERELLRAIEFGKTALNPSSITELQRIALAYSLDSSTLFEPETETDDADE